MNPTLVDLFAGAGGWSHGWRIATQRDPIIAIDHCAHAVKWHRINHPSTQHFLEDVRAVDPIAALAGRRADWVHLSPDCFPAGTPVLTIRGSVPIENVAVGTLVLTHNGRWRCVTSAMSAKKRTIMLRGQGHPGLEVSAEHPFLADNGESWVAAGDMLGHRWATPASVYTGPAHASLPSVGNIFWLAGRYVADGWTRLSEPGSGRHDACLTLTIGAEKVAHARAELAKTGLVWREREMPTSTVQFSAAHRALASWLRLNFGHLAHGKRIAGWLLGDCELNRREFLRGYMSGDGYSNGKTMEATTVSRCLAADIRVLVATLGYSPCMYEGNEAGEATIEGRTVTQRQSWSVRWKIDPSRVQTKRSPGHLWGRVKGVSTGRELVEVFNLSVEEDESYVADGMVVHNCTHFSRAKGGKPREQGIRGLAWVGVDWAKAARPRILSLENVAEFQTWGPLDENGYPIKERSGETFREFVASLEALGYVVDWRVLCAADFGAPTIRRRLFLVARRDGLPIVWPDPTHGPGRAKPWRTAAECIDWTIPCKSIFDRKRPLAEATCRRIAAGIVRYVLRSANPFLVLCNHGGDGFRGQSINEPMRTVTAARDAHGLVAPTLIQTGYGERNGQRPRALDIEAPLGTLVAGGAKHGLVAAFLQQHFTGMVGKPLSVPVPTITARDHHSLVAASLTALRGTGASHIHGDAIDAPLRTVSAGGSHHALVAAFLAKHGPRETQPQLFDDGIGSEAVTLEIDGKTYAIADIGLRMLEPRELARAQGFPDSYVIEGTKTQQIARIGNSVSPQVAAALVRANFWEEAAVA